jgi:hypothetical protein
MHRLGMLQGEARLEVNGKDIGTIEYQLSVWQHGASKNASGSADGNMEALQRAFEAGAAKINLASGGSIDIVVTSLNGREAEFRVSGSVPGF